MKRRCSWWPQSILGFNFPLQIMFIAGVFVSAEWSANDNRFLIVADKKKPKPESFFCTRPELNTEVGKSPCRVTLLNRRLYHQLNTVSFIFSCFGFHYYDWEFPWANILSKGRSTKGQLLVSPHIAGAKYRFEEDWGEGHEGIHNPVIVVLDIPKEQTSMIRTQMIELENCSLGQAIFTPDEKGNQAGILSTEYILLSASACPLSE